MKLAGTDCVRKHPASYFVIICSCVVVCKVTDFGLYVKCCPCNLVFVWIYPLIGNPEKASLCDYIRCLFYLYLYSYLPSEYDKNNATWMRGSPGPRDCLSANVRQLDLIWSTMDELRGGEWRRFHSTSVITMTSQVDKGGVDVFFFFFVESDAT